MSVQWNPRWRAFGKVLYIGTVVPNFLKKKEKKIDSGTGTTLIGTGIIQAKTSSNLLVPVPHLLVLVPSGVNGLI